MLLFEHRTGLCFPLLRLEQLHVPFCLFTGSLQLTTLQDHQTQRVPRVQAGCQGVPGCQGLSVQSLHQGRAGRLGGEAHGTGPVRTHTLTACSTAPTPQLGWGRHGCAGAVLGAGVRGRAGVGWWLWARGPGPHPHLSSSASPLSHPVTAFNLSLRLEIEFY